MPTIDPTAEPAALVVEEVIVVCRLMHSGAPFWDMHGDGLSGAPFEKVHRRANHQGDILIHQGA